MNTVTITPALETSGARSGAAPAGSAAPLFPGGADVCTDAAPPFTARPIRDELQRALASARRRKCRA